MSTTDSRLYPGDCLEVLPLLPEGSVQLVVTSPPYNVGWHYGDDGTGDRLPLCCYLALLGDALAGCHRVLRGGGVLALNLPPTIRQPEGRAWPLSAWCQMHLLDAGWLLREPIAWVKSYHNGEGDPVPWAPGTAVGAASNPYLRAAHEGIILASKMTYAIPGKREWPSANGHYLGWLKDTWHLPPGRARPGEPLAFPDELVARLVLLFSNPGDVVLDPFAGTGTVGRVARLHGRVAWLIEKCPAFWPLCEAAIGQGVLALEGGVTWSGT